MNPQIREITTDTVALSYQEHTGSDVFDHYLFTLTPQDTGSQQQPQQNSKNRDDADRVVRFQDLLPGNVYRVTVWTTSGMENSDTITKDILTGNACVFVRTAPVQIFVHSKR